MKVLDKENKIFETVGESASRNGLRFLSVQATDGSLFLWKEVVEFFRGFVTEIVEMMWFHIKGGKNDRSCCRSSY